MARKQLSEEEKQKIKDSLNATRERRKAQAIKIIELKVNCHQTSKETFAKMDNCFNKQNGLKMICLLGQKNVMKIIFLSMNI